MPEISMPASRIGVKFTPGMMMRYSQFAPRLYNLCKSLGFQPGRMLPSRAFCSDESQGFPVILLAKHFGAFPFNHGQVGVVVATDRHGPHADHGQEMVIIQASHVGYDADSGVFGRYCRLQSEDHHYTTACGKLSAVLQWYLNEYEFACQNVQLCLEAGQRAVVVDNQLLDQRQPEGLRLNLDRLLARDAQGYPLLLRTLSTARCFVAADALVAALAETYWVEGRKTPLGKELIPEYFYFGQADGSLQAGAVREQLEENILAHMPYIVTSDAPLLAAAQYSTQAEFDRTFRSIVRAPEYRRKRLLFVSCVNIDISPRSGQLFPLTKCVPWAAYYQDGKGDSWTMEQQELVRALLAQPVENPDQADLEVAIRQMIEAEEVRVQL